MPQDMIDQVLQLGKNKKVLEGMVFKNNQGQIVEKVDAYESTITVAGAYTTGLNEPQNTKTITTTKM